MRVLEMFLEAAKPEEFAGQRVLEVGSRDVNGSLRRTIEKLLACRQYVGIDVRGGKNVDVVLPAERALSYFGENTFDIIVSTELLEHVRDWRAVIYNMKSLLRPGGFIYVTTRSFGFPYHGYPNDYWRYEPEDIRYIFSDFELLSLKLDEDAPGLFFKARKPSNWAPRDLSKVALYSIVLGKRTIVTPHYSQLPLGKKIRLQTYTFVENVVKPFIVRRVLFG